MLGEGDAASLGEKQVYDGEVRGHRRRDGVAAGGVKSKRDLDYEWQAIEEDMAGARGPDAQDLVVNQRGDRWEVSEIEGRYNETFDSQREMERELNRKFKRDNFYPSVWWHNERGDPTDVYDFEHV